MTRLYFPLLMFLPILMLSSPAGAQKGASSSHTFERTQTMLAQNTTNQTLVNVGQVAMWIYADGKSALSPVGNSGFYFPRGSEPPTAVVFQDGLVWGGQISDGQQPVIRVGGAQYNVGHVAGAIISPGVPEDRNNPDVNRIWRVRRDFASADLRLDAAEFNSIRQQDVPQAQIDEVREIYRRDWTEWPAEKGAPFYDADGDGQYTPGFNADGTPKLKPPPGEDFNPAIHADEPGIAEADQVVWLVSNDLDESRLNSFSGSPPIGFEQQITLWSYASTAEVGRAVFKRFRLIYKGDLDTPANATIDSVYIGQWADTDVGSAGDDLAGCDTTLDLGYAYNSSSSDAVYAAVGLPPPAVGYDLLSGPIVPDPSGTGVFDLKPRDGFRNQRMTTFALFAAGSQTSDPGPLGTYQVTLQWWNLLRGFLPRPESPATPFTDPTTGQPTKFLVPGDPITGSGWIDRGSGDRRLEFASGPFAMAVGDTQETVIATITGIGSDRLTSVSALKFTSIQVQHAYDNLTRGQVTPETLALEATALDQKVILQWPDIRDAVENSRGYEFEGYNIYQAESPAGPWHRIATFDEINNVGIIFDEQFDPETGVIINMPVQFGRDTGVRHFMEIEHDIISGSRLMNGTDYYFGASSYVYSPDDEPSAIESPIVSVQVTPIGPVIGTDYSEVTADTLAEHIAGQSNGRVYVTVVDPTQVTGHTYEVFFEQDEETDEILWNLVDTNTGSTLLSRQKQAEELTNGSAPLVDGLLLQVVGPAPAIAGPGEADGMVEVQADGQPLTEEHFDPGGAPFGGNKVWHSLNAEGFSDRYYVSAGGGAGDIERIERNIQNAVPFDFEMRLTSLEEGSWGWWAFSDGSSKQVPFTLWNVGVGTHDDPSDDVRLIPILFGESADGWAVGDPNGTDPAFGFQCADWVYYYFDSRGYDAFEADAMDGFVDDGTFGELEYLARMMLCDFDSNDKVAGPGYIIRINTTKPNTVDDRFRFSTTSFMTFDVTKGDINDDGGIDVADVVLLVDFILKLVDPSGPQEYASDFNNDLAVNVADVVAIVNNILGITQPEPVAAADQITLDLQEQALIENGIASVPVTIRSETPVHGMQITLDYDESLLRPLAPPEGDNVQIFHHERDGEVIYVITALDGKSLPLTQLPAFQFEIQDEDKKNSGAKVTLSEAISADASGQAHKTKIGNGVAATHFMPESFALHQNFPNPFNPTTTLRFDLPEDSKVSIDIYNVLGQRVRQLVHDQDMPAGQHNLRWNGRDDRGGQLASGVYIMRMRVADFVKSRKIMLVK